MHSTITYVFNYRINCWNSISDDTFSVLFTMLLHWINLFSTNMNHFDRFPDPVILWLGILSIFNTQSILTNPFLIRTLEDFLLLFIFLVWILFSEKIVLKLSLFVVKTRWLQLIIHNFVYQGRNFFLQSAFDNRFCHTLIFVWLRALKYLLKPLDLLKLPSIDNRWW